MVNFKEGQEVEVGTWLLNKTQSDATCKRTQKKNKGIKIKLPQIFNLIRNVLKYSVTNHHIKLFD